MYITCLDLEGVLVPEIWIAFAEESGIPELTRTTRDEPDYGKLMDFRLDILRQHGLGLKEIQETIARIDPLPGAKDFLDELRATTQAVIISDTFTQFAQPLMAKLGWPALFCNELEVADDGTIAGFRMRCPESKLTTVRALQSCGFDTIAAGDSHNDLGMIRASKAGFLFRSPDSIKAENPDLKKRIDRALLVVGKNGSSELVATLKNLVMHTWFDLFHVDETRLSSEAMVVVWFTLGGLVEIMSDEACRGDHANPLQAILSSGVATSASSNVVATLRAAADEHRAKTPMPQATANAVKP